MLYVCRILADLYVGCHREVSRPLIKLITVCVRFLTVGLTGLRNYRLVEVEMREE